MNNKAVLGALSLDLKRVAIGYFRGSDVMAQRFFQEAIVRSNELDQKQLRFYVKNIVEKIKRLKFSKNKQEIAEEVLMYSVLLQNAAVYGEN